MPPASSSAKVGCPMQHEMKCVQSSRRELTRFERRVAVHGELVHRTVSVHDLLRPRVLPILPNDRRVGRELHVVVEMDPARSLRGVEKHVAVTARTERVRSRIGYGAVAVVNDVGSLFLEEGLAARELLGSGRKQVGVGQPRRQRHLLLDVREARVIERGPLAQDRGVQDRPALALGNRGEGGLGRDQPLDRPTGAAGERHQHGDAQIPVRARDAEKARDVPVAADGHRVVLDVVQADQHLGRGVLPVLRKTAEGVAPRRPRRRLAGLLEPRRRVLARSPLAVLAHPVEPRRRLEDSELVELRLRIGRVDVGAADLLHVVTGPVRGVVEVAFDGAERHEDSERDLVTDVQGDASRRAPRG